MNASKTIHAALASTQNMLGMYLGDLSDADLLVRPVPGANHIAWQLGHLIFAESHLVSPQLPDTRYPSMPANFADLYGKKGASDDTPSHFLSKDAYLRMFNEHRDVSKAAVAKLSDPDFDRPTVGEMAAFAPKLGDLLLAVANHTLMHAGQFTVVRRKLGKPVLF